MASAVLEDAKGVSSDSFAFKRNKRTIDHPAYTTQALAILQAILQLADSNTTKRMANASRLPGALVADSNPAARLSRNTLQGRTVSSQPIRESDADPLFTHIGGIDKSWQWDYTSESPCAPFHRDRPCHVPAYPAAEDSRRATPS